MLEPPRPPLSFDRLISLAQEDGFAELRAGTGFNEIWSNPEVRAAIRHRQLLICSEDELSLLAIEWRRVRHFIIDEEDYWRSIIDSRDGPPMDDSDWDRLEMIDDHLVQCELQSRLERLQVDHAHISADLERGRQLLVDVVDMSLVESERLRHPMGRPYGATDHRSLPDVPIRRLLPVYQKPLVRTGVPVTGGSNRHFDALTMDEVNELFDANLQMEAEVDLPDDLGVGLAGA